MPKAQPWLIPNPVDPFGMADLGFAQTPRGLAETQPAPIKRRPSQSKLRPLAAEPPRLILTFFGGAD